MIDKQAEACLVHLGRHHQDRLLVTAAQTLVRQTILKCISRLHPSVSGESNAPATKVLISIKATASKDISHHAHQKDQLKT